MNSWLVYILECSDGSFYTGITNNLEKRVNRHNQGLGAKYTSARRPVVVKYTQEFSNRSEASRRESEIKKLSREKKLRMIKYKKPNGL